MKLAITAAVVALALAQLASAGSNEGDKIVQALSACIPTNWIAAPSAKPAPLRGLTNPAAQIVLTESSKTLTWDLSPAKSQTFHPTVILMAFPAGRSKEIETAVEQQKIRSDYPPLIFCSNAQYVFVTSPGYINRGLHTLAAEATLTDLKAALAKSMIIEYNIEPAHPAEPSPSSGR
jgi:hypothetical protein